MRGSDDNKTRCDEGEAGRSLLVAGKGLFETHELPEGGREVSLVIGRSPDVDIVVPHHSVSRRHACLRLADEVTFEDLASSNGSSLNNKPLRAHQPIKLRPGDVIRVGHVMLILRDVQSADPPPPRARSAAPEPVRRSPVMDALYRLVDTVAPSTINVLILGETGVGKEVVAREVHQRSTRREKPFLGLNCATFSETLLESELFGHEKGAFTGAQEAKPGLLECAAGGTVFLDEIGDLPLSLQAKLLRVLEERQVRPVGSLKARSIDVRFVTATNRDLDVEAKTGRFRKDLFFRLNGITIAIPPLRERQDEIEALASEFGASAAVALGRPTPPTFAPQTLRALVEHSWPGNVRELRNVIERAVLLCRAGEILPEHLQLVPALAPSGAAQPPPATAAEVATKPTSLPEELKLLEKERIFAALEACGGNQTRAAKQLGIPRRSLIKKLELYGAPRPRKKSLEETESD